MAKRYSYPEPLPLGIQTDVYTYSEHRDPHGAFMNINRLEHNRGFVITNEVAEELKRRNLLRYDRSTHMRVLYDLPVFIDPDLAVNPPVEIVESYMDLRAGYSYDIDELAAYLDVQISKSGHVAGRIDQHPNLRITGEIIGDLYYIHLLEIREDPNKYAWRQFEQQRARLVPEDREMQMARDVFENTKEPLYVVKIPVLADITTTSISELAEPRSGISAKSITIQEVERYFGEHITNHNADS